MTSWDDLRALIESIHDSFAMTLQHSYPCLWSCSEAWANDVFPLSSALTVNLTGGDREEDVVLTARFLNASYGVSFDSDISREDGQLLAQGPESRWLPDELSSQQIHWAASNLASYDHFLKYNLGLVSRELEKLNAGTSSGS